MWNKMKTHVTVINFNPESLVFVESLYNEWRGCGSSLEETSICPLRVEETSWDYSFKATSFLDYFPKEFLNI